MSRDEKVYNKAIVKALEESQGPNSPTDKQTPSKTLSKCVHDDDFVPNNTLSSSEGDFSKEEFSEDSDFSSSPPGKKMFKKKETKKKSVATKTAAQKKPAKPQSKSPSKSNTLALSSSAPKDVLKSDSSLSAETTNTTYQPEPKIVLKRISPTVETLPVSITSKTLSKHINDDDFVLNNTHQPEPKIVLKRIPPTAETLPISTTPKTTQLSTPKTKHSLSVGEPSSIRKFPKWTPPSTTANGGVVNVRPSSVVSSGSPVIRVGLSRHAKVKPLHRNKT